MLEAFFGKEVWKLSNRQVGDEQRLNVKYCGVSELNYKNYVEIFEWIVVIGL